MADTRKKPLMRSLGEFFGHIVKGIRTDPTSERRVVKKQVEQKQQGNMILRRTTIEEIEIKQPEAAPDERSEESADENGSV